MLYAITWMKKICQGMVNDSRMMKHIDGWNVTKAMKFTLIRLWNHVMMKNTGSNLYHEQSFWTGVKLEGNQVQQLFLAKTNQIYCGLAPIGDRHYLAAWSNSNQGDKILTKICNKNNEKRFQNSQTCQDCFCPQNVLE